MKALVLFGTTEGHTRKVADFIAGQLKAANCDVNMVEAVAVRSDLDPSQFDVVIIAASIHVGKYQPRVVEFARKHSAALNAMNAAFVSVSLAAAGTEREDIDGIKACVAAFSQATHWTPRNVHHSAGAFRFTHYDFFKTWAMRYIAWRKNIGVVAGQDLELTDWVALAGFINKLLGDDKSTHESSSNP